MSGITSYLNESFLKQTFVLQKLRYALQKQSFCIPKVLQVLAL